MMRAVRSTNIFVDALSLYRSSSWQHMRSHFHPHHTKPLYLASRVLNRSRMRSQFTAPVNLQHCHPPPLMLFFPSIHLTAGRLPDVDRCSYSECLRISQLVHSACHINTQVQTSFLANTPEQSNAMWKFLQLHP